MKVLFIGGTGTISMAISKSLIERGDELYLLNRGNRKRELRGAKYIIADINDRETVEEKIKDMKFDVVADFIAYEVDDVKRDYSLFAGRTRQYIFISSASAYQKPLQNYIITEDTPLANKYWKYSQDKIECEKFLMHMYRENDFPVTIVRPSHTYDNRSIPIGLHGNKGSWQVIKRMMEGKKVLVPGDGTTLWTVTYNTDFAKGFVGLMGNYHALGQAVNIVSGEALTWNQIYQIVADALGVKYNPVYVSSEFLDKCSDYNYRGSMIGDKSNCVVFDISKLKKLVPDFVATTRFDEGVRLALDNILKHPELQEEDKEFDEFCDKVISALDEAVEKVRG